MIFDKIQIQIACEFFFFFVLLDGTMACETTYNLHAQGSIPGHLCETNVSVPLILHYECIGSYGGFVWFMDLLQFLRSFFKAMDFDVHHCIDNMYKCINLIRVKFGLCVMSELDYTYIKGPLSLVLGVVMNLGALWRKTLGIQC